MLIEFSKFTNIPRRFCGYIGLIPFYDDPSINDVKKYRYKHMIFWTSFLILTICLIGEFIYLFKGMGNFTNFLEITALAPCIGFVMLALTKMFAIWYNRPKLTELMNTLKQIYPNRKSQQKKWKVGNYCRSTNSLMFLFSTLYMILIWIFNFMPLAITIYKLVKTGEYKRELPYFIWYPFDVYKAGIFEIIYLIQVWAGFTAAAGILSADLLFCSVITQICMHFDILGIEIRKFIPGKSDKDYQNLIDLIHRHNLLIKITKQLEEMFSPSILINYLGSSVIICLVGFQATAGVSPHEMFKFILFLVAQLAQIFIMCWYGNKVIESSFGISDAIYEEEWFNAELRYKKSLILMITRSQKPSQLTAYKFSVVSMQSFMRILSSSYSYFTLLRTMYNPTKSI